MKKFLIIFLVSLTIASCSKENPEQFSKEALEDVFISVDDENVPFKNILEKHTGKKIVIDVWASWCPDCLEGLPEIRKIQEENADVVYVFLSLDRNQNDWKTALQRLKLKGDHYFMQSGWEGKMGKFLGLNWIPRYLVIDETGKIVVFNATKATDKLIRQSLEIM